MMRTTALILAAAGAFALQAPAGAEEISIRVEYPDLDLRKQHDVEVLKLRVAAAIREACDLPGGTLAPTQERRCRDDATALALREIERHRLRYAALESQPAG